MTELKFNADLMQKKACRIIESCQQVPEYLPSPREGFLGRIMDRIFGPVKKPQAEMVLTKMEQELLKEYMENPEKVNAAANACAMTAEDIKEAADRLVVLARGHHIRNADGTVTDVSNDPNYECKE